jgi:two-component system cell cycle response regulator
VSGSAEALSVTISIGVATTLDDKDSPDALLKRADEAVYQAKSKGRNLVVLQAA